MSLLPSISMKYLARTSVEGVAAMTLSGAGTALAPDGNRACRRPASSGIVAPSSAALAAAAASASESHNKR